MRSKGKKRFVGDVKPFEILTRVTDTCDCRVLTEELCALVLQGSVLVGVFSVVFPLFDASSLLFNLPPK